MFFTEDHEYIRDLAREFAEKELAPIAQEIDQTDTIPSASMISWRTWASSD
jgi:alkylation response protein AidB-like acyl-CoA dehydrogenase